MKFRSTGDKLVKKYQRRPNRIVDGAMKILRALQNMLVLIQGALPLWGSIAACTLSFVCLSSTLHLSDCVTCACLSRMKFKQAKLFSDVQDGPRKSRPLRLKAHIFCLYLQNTWTNYHDFWLTSTSFYSEHIHLFHVPQTHHKVAPPSELS